MTTVTLTELVTLGPSAGELVLTQDQLSRLSARRNCLAPGAGKAHSLREDAHFKAGERVTFVGNIPKGLSGKYREPEAGPEAEQSDKPTRKSKAKSDDSG